MTNATTFVNGTTLTDAGWFNDVNRTLYTNVIDVKNYGALGNNVQDDTSFINAAIAALGNSGGVLLFPPGIYKITSALTISQSGVLVTGTGMNTQIYQSTANTPIFNVTGPSNTFRSMLIAYAGGVVPVSGGNAFSVSTSNNHWHNIFINSSYNGFEFTAGTSNFMTDILINGYISSGLYAHGGVSDIYITNFIMNAGTAAKGANGGIRLADLVQGFAATNGDIINGVYSLLVTSASFAAAARPAFNKFTNVIFDSAATSGVSLTNCVSFDFINCQFGAGTTPATTANGCDINQSDSLRFNNCSFVNSGGHGCNVATTTAKHISFANCSFEGNSTVAGSGVAHGLNIVANVNDFRVQGCTAGNNFSWSGGLQGFGVKVATGTSDRYIIADNLVTGNVSGGVSDGGSGANKRVANNY